MDTPENTSLEEVNKSARGALEQVCLENGVDYERLLELTGKLAAAASCAMGVLVEAFASLSYALAETIPPVVAALSSNLSSVFDQWDSELFWMVPPHIKHLAYNHPKARVRNKNWNRMWKIRERYMKCHKE
jgi:hypothetical protein